MSDASFGRSLRSLTGLLPKLQSGAQSNLYWTGVAQLIGVIVAYFFDVYLFEGQWGLLQDFSFYWILQFVTLLEVWHIAAFDIVTKDDITRCNAAGFFATVLLLGGLLPLTIQEIHQCSSIDDATHDALRQCYQSVATAHGADLAHSCQADTDISTRATGICPQVRFGTGNGIGWIVFQLFLVAFFLVTNVMILFFFLPNTIKAEAAIKKEALREAAQPPAYAAAGILQSAPMGTRFVMPSGSPVTADARKTLLRFTSKK